MSDLNCPYCDAELEINHDDGFGYDQHNKQQMECGECGKVFVFETYISFSYTPEQADCLNDGKHKWKPTHTYPKEFIKMRCCMCDEERDPTESEWNEINKKP